jgi:hypothetical protein
MKTVRMPWDYWYDKRGNIERCGKCNAPWHWDMLTNYQHDDAICRHRQALTARAEIKKLKTSLDAWKDEWFKLRGIIGHLWWHHPAITSEAELLYCQNYLKRIEENKK